MKAHRTIRLAAAATLSLSVAACSSSSKPKSQTKTTTSTLSPGQKTVTTVLNAPVGDPCVYIGPSNAAHLFGLAERALHKKAGPIINGQSCTFSTLANNITYVLTVSIQQGTATYGERYIANAQHLAGLGDTAFVAKHSIGDAVIIGLVAHDRTYTITYAKNGTPGSNVNAAAQADELLALVRSGLARSS